MAISDPHRCPHDVDMSEINCGVANLPRVYRGENLAVVWWGHREKSPVRWADALFTMLWTTYISVVWPWRLAQVHGCL